MPRNTLSASGPQRAANGTLALPPRGLMYNKLRARALRFTMTLSAEETVQNQLLQHTEQGASLAPRITDANLITTQQDINAHTALDSKPGEVTEQLTTNQAGPEKPTTHMKDPNIRGVKKSVKYVPRFSFFEAENEVAVTDPFRGFYVLFWICLGTQVLSAFARSFERTGEILSMTLATLMSRDLLMLAIGDAVLVGQTFLCVPLVKLLHRYRIPRDKRLLLFLCLWYFLIEVAVIAWIRVRYVL